MVINIYVQLLFENNVFIINNGFFKFKNVDWSTNWIVNKLKNSYQIPFQIVIMTIYALKNYWCDMFFFKNLFKW